MKHVCSIKVPSVLVGAISVFVLAVGCQAPSKIELTPNEIAFESIGANTLVRAVILDEDGKEMSSKGVELYWSSEDPKIANVNDYGEVRSVDSGETKIQVSIADTDIKAEASVWVKIPDSIHLSTEKLRLWEGEVKDDIFADVRSEKGTYLEGFLPEWRSEDPNVVKVDTIKSEGARQSRVKLEGVKAGTTRVTASFRGIENSIRVSVFNEDTEVVMAGIGISEKKREDARKEARRKEKNKPRKLSF